MRSSLEGSATTPDPEHQVRPVRQRAQHPGLHLVTRELIQQELLAGALHAWGIGGVELDQPAQVSDLQSRQPRVYPDGGITAAYVTPE